MHRNAMFCCAILSTVVWLPLTCAKANAGRPGRSVSRFYLGGRGGRRNQHRVRHEIQKRLLNASHRMWPVRCKRHLFIHSYYNTRLLLQGTKIVMLYKRHGSFLSEMKVVVDRRDEAYDTMCIMRQCWILTHCAGIIFYYSRYTCISYLTRWLL